jgi:hypothetical protein
MEKHGIKNESQIHTWMRWYRSNEIYRFGQPIGKQYTYGLGPDSASEDDKKERQLSHLKTENEIVAYKLYDHQQTPLVIDTLRMALESRNNPEGVIIHSDQGSVYTSYAFQDFVKRKYLTSSMSRRGNCWDNAVIESFHSNLKSEVFQYVKFNSLSDYEVRERVNNYLTYYNEERIQEKLGYLTPIKYGVAVA